MSAQRESSLYVGQNNGTIVEYSATKGAIINANFIIGLNYPMGLALLGNTLFTANYGDPGTVGEYNAHHGSRDQR